MTELKVDAIAEKDIDFEEIAHLQNRAHRAADLVGDRVPNYYMWKYNVLGESSLVGARRNGTLISMCGAISTRYGGNPVWQVADIATDPNYQNKGVFKACLNRLLDLIRSDNIICFPNAASRQVLSKLNWKVISEASLYVRPALGLLGGPTSDPWPFESDLASYVSRRYIQREPKVYQVIENSSHIHRSWLVMRKMSLGPIPAALVVDYENMSADNLVANANRWAIENACRLVVAGLDRTIDSPLKRKMVRIPNQLLPRRIISMTVPDSTLESRIKCLGEWDAI